MRSAGNGPLAAWNGRIARATIAPGPQLAGNRRPRKARTATRWPSAWVTMAATVAPRVSTTAAPAVCGLAWAACHAVTTPRTTMAKAHGSHSRPIGRGIERRKRRCRARQPVRRPCWSSHRGIAAEGKPLPSAGLTTGPFCPAPLRGRPKAAGHVDRLERVARDLDDLDSRDWERLTEPGHRGTRVNPHEGSGGDTVAFRA